MITEQEVIEQLADEEFGRPLSWIRDFIVGCERPDPLAVLERMYLADQLTLAESDGV